MDFWFGFEWIIETWNFLVEFFDLGDVIGIALVTILAIGFARGAD